MLGQSQLGKDVRPRGELPNAQSKEVQKLFFEDLCLAWNLVDEWEETIQREHDENHPSFSPHCGSIWGCFLPFAPRPSVEHIGRLRRREAEGAVSEQGRRGVSALELMVPKPRLALGSQTYIDLHILEAKVLAVFLSQRDCIGGLQAYCSRKLAHRWLTRDHCGGISQDLELESN